MLYTERDKGAINKCLVPARVDDDALVVIVDVERDEVAVVVSAVVAVGEM